MIYTRIDDFEYVHLIIYKNMVKEKHKIHQFLY